MPFIEISITAGRDPQQLRTLLDDVHNAVQRSLDTPAENIRVVIREVLPENWLSGGVTLAEKARSGSRP